MHNLPDPPSLSENTDPRPRKRVYTLKGKRAVLDVTCTTLATVRDDITRWLASSVPVLDIERYPYRVV